LTRSSATAEIARDADDVDFSVDYLIKKLNPRKSAPSDHNARLSQTNGTDEP